MTSPLDQSSAAIRPNIGAGWYEQLKGEFAAPYFSELKSFLIQERAAHTIFPRGSALFHAFDRTAFDAVRVVILGQDPYHGPGQAHGLCFSVPSGVPAPPSLLNVFKEIERDLGIPKPRNGDLSPWADQGVLLLNTTLTVRANEPGSHQGRGWERFTDAAINALARERTGIVFMLWGRYAQNKEALIGDQHYVLKAPHPSPLSAHRGFIGCGHFGQANELLIAQGSAPIDWRL